MKVGWAAVDEKGIDVSTVSPSRTASMINWLCVNRGFMIPRDVTEGQIQQLWDEHKDESVDVCRVNITMEVH